MFPTRAPGVSFDNFSSNSIWPEFGQMPAPHSYKMLLTIALSNARARVCVCVCVCGGLFLWNVICSALSLDTPQIPDPPTWQEILQSDFLMYGKLVEAQRQMGWVGDGASRFKLAVGAHAAHCRLWQFMVCKGDCVWRTSRVRHSPQSSHCNLHACQERAAEICWMINGPACPNCILSCFNATDDFDYIQTLDVSPSLCAHCAHSLETSTPWHPNMPKLGVHDWPGTSRDWSCHFSEGVWRFRRSWSSLATIAGLQQQNAQEP